NARRKLVEHKVCRPLPKRLDDTPELGHAVSLDAIAVIYFARHGRSLGSMSMSTISLARLQATRHDLHRIGTGGFWSSLLFDEIAADIASSARSMSWAAMRLMASDAACARVSG